MLAHGEPAADDAERLRGVVVRCLELWPRGPRADFDGVHHIDHCPAGRAASRGGFRGIGSWTSRSGRSATGGARWILEIWGESDDPVIIEQPGAPRGD